MPLSLGDVTFDASVEVIVSFLCAPAAVRKNGCCPRVDMRAHFHLPKFIVYSNAVTEALDIHRHLFRAISAATELHWSLFSNFPGMHVPVLLFF